MVDYAALEEVRAYAEFKTVDEANDTLIESLITQVSRLIDKLTGRTFAPSADATYYLPFCEVDGRDLYLGTLDHPLLSVTTLKNGDGTTIASTEYLLLPRAHANTAPRFNTIRLKEVSDVDWEDNDDGDGYIEITGRWGWSLTVPEDVKMATIEAVAFVFKNRKTIENSERAQASGDGLLLMPSMLPKRTLVLIEQYKKKAV
jgi:hypothetical protein